MLPGLGGDGEAPFAEGFRSIEACGIGLEVSFVEFDPSIVCSLKQTDNGGNSAPSHCAGPRERLVDGAQECPVPVVLQNPPAAFNQIVFAMIGWIVNQFDFQTCLVAKIHDAFHKLGATAIDLGAVVQVNLQTSNVWMCIASLRPPQIQAVCNKVAGVAGCSKDNCQLIGLLLNDPGGDEDRLGRHVMIQSLDRLSGTQTPPSGEVADLDFGLCIDGNPQGFRVCRGPIVGCVDVFEDGVGFGDFFSGRVFRTRLSR
jgi:hypothetical protein